MNRLAIFADPHDLAARILLPPLLAAVADRSDMECVALLVTPTSSAWRRRLRWHRARAARRVQAALGSGRWDRGLDVPPLDAPSLASRYGIPCRPMPGGDPNHADVLAYLRGERKACLALNVYCRRLFREELLGLFDMTVNYHNGALPRFRGLRASNWSLYMGQAASGCAFHVMDTSLDSGNVLWTGEVPVTEGDVAADLEARKAFSASRHLPDLLDAMARRDRGQPQAGIACLHDRAAWEQAVRVADPMSLSQAEWQRRLRAFLRVETWLEGAWRPVTGVAPGRGPGHLAFRTADGQWLSVTGLDFWPARWPAWRRRGTRHE